VNIERLKARREELQRSLAVVGEQYRELQNQSLKLEERALMLKGALGVLEELLADAETPEDAPQEDESPEEEEAKDKI